MYSFEELMAQPNKEKRNNIIHYLQTPLDQSKLKEIRKPQREEIYEGNSGTVIKRLFPQGFLCPDCGNKMRVKERWLECTSESCGVIEVRVSLPLGGFWVKREGVSQPHYRKRGHK